MSKLKDRLLTWYDKWLRPLPLASKVLAEDIGKHLTDFADALDELKDAPRSCRSNCAAAKARGGKETEYVTGCEWCLPLQEECPECPHWSESRYFAAFGKLIGKGFAAGLGYPVKEEADGDG